MTRLHHVAIKVAEFDRYVELFQKLGMSIQKSRGEAPARELWFVEGIQLKEVAGEPSGKVDQLVDHVALGVHSMAETKQIALDNGCSPLPRGEKWFALPNGVEIELMEE